jgi:lysophospholipase L1-like esterase
MGDTHSSRPRRSRAGLILFLALLGAVAWDVAARATGVTGLTPSRFVAAVWQVAHQASDADLERMAYRPLPYVMWGLKPDFEREPGRLNLTRTTNSLGFRGREVELPKPQGRYRIVCLGGSTTYDDDVNDDETSVVRLEALLRAARPGQDIELINAGVPSYTSAEDLPNLAFRCLDLQPDAVLIYQGINDYRARLYRNFDSAYFHYRKVWDGSANGQEFGEGEMAQGINTFIQRKQPADNGDNAENARRAGTSAYRRNLVSMAGIARAHGLKCIFVTSICDPKNQYTTHEFEAGIAEQNEVMKQVAAEQGALLVDLAAAYPGGDFFVDSVHNNAAGAQEKARIIADGLLAGLLK